MKITTQTIRRIEVAGEEGLIAYEQLLQWARAKDYTIVWTALPSCRTTIEKVIKSGEADIPASYFRLDRELTEALAEVGRIPLEEPDHAGDLYRALDELMGAYGGDCPDWLQDEYDAAHRALANYEKDADVERPHWRKPKDV